MAVITCAFGSASSAARGAWLTALLIFGCGSSSNSSSNDPLANASVVSCNMQSDLVCREYDRVSMGDFSSFPNLTEARQICAAGWPGGSGTPGDFEGVACATDNALARCVVTVGDAVPPYVAVDYYYVGFGDTATLPDPVAPIAAACAKIQSDAEAMGINRTSVLQKPPF